MQLSHYGNSATVFRSVSGQNLPNCYNSEKRKDFREDFYYLYKLWFLFLLILKKHIWVLVKLIQMF